jgi:hypothetical protein
MSFSYDRERAPFCRSLESNGLRLGPRDFLCGNKSKGESKVHPRTGHEGLEGVEV